MFFFKLNAFKHLILFVFICLWLLMSLEYVLSYSQKRWCLKCRHSNQGVIPLHHRSFSLCRMYHSNYDNLYGLLRWKNTAIVCTMEADRIGISNAASFHKVLLSRFFNPPRIQGKKKMTLKWSIWQCLFPNVI